MSQTESIGRRIQKLLELRDMTQRDLARKVGITEVSIGRYIKDAREPKATVLADIALALDSTTDYIIGITDSPNKTTNKTEEKNITIPIAAHFKGKEMTEEQRKRIEKFIEFTLNEDD